jgi:hypothetical protein
VTLKCSHQIVEATLASLQKAGERGHEGIVLWLADRANPSVIVEAYVPRHVAQADRFWMSSEAMNEMMDHLRSTRRAAAAQVHSHPGLAFHSQVDDTYALPQHAGAFSVVVPFFGAGTTSDNFEQCSAFFVLSSEGKWEPMGMPDTQDHLEIEK